LLPLNFPDMKNRIKLKIISGFLLGLCITVVTQVFSYLSLRDLNSSNQWITHTYQVLSQSEDVLASLVTLESNLRGYVITGNPVFFGGGEPYTAFRNNAADIEQSIGRLGTMTADNRRQQANISALKNYTEQRIALMQRQVQMKMSGVPADSLAQLAEEGKLITDQVRSLVQRIEEEEQRLLSLRSQENSRIVSRILLEVFLSGLIALLILSFFLYSIFRDLNVKKKMEEQLTASESKLKQFLEALPVGVYVVDKNGSVQYTNRQSLAILGRELLKGAELAGYSKVYGAFRKNTNVEYPLLEMPLVKALNGEVARVEDMEIHRDKDIVLLEINGCPIYDSEGKVAYAMASFMDITQRKKSETELQKAKEIAEQSVRIKENFLANMSHEIRTPMNAIIGFAGLLEKSELNHDQQQFVNAINTAGENLLAIINDILDLSKIDAGMMLLEEIPFSPANLIDSLAVLMQNKAAEKRLILEVHKSERLPSTVAGDPTRLTQVLVNLVGNAVKFTQKGSVTLLAEVEEEWSSTCKLRFTVKDTGVGIPPDRISSIFDRFRQAGTDVSRKYGGTGLGLSIVKNLVEMQGGTVHVTSEPGKGSVFSVVIPYRKARMGEQESSGSQPDSKALRHPVKLRILLAEDNLMNQKLALKVLEGEFGFDVEIADNGKIALDKLRRESYDVVLMDIQMPEMDGYEATTEIRNTLGLDVPVIAMTAHAMSGEREKCLALGFNEYISKPFKVETLLSTIVTFAGEKPAPEPKKTNSMNEKLTNLSYLQNLAKGDAAFMKDMLQTFILQMPQYMKNLKDATENGSWEEVRITAHKMNSPLNMLGVVHLEEIIRKIEEYALNKVHLDEVPALVATTEDICSKALTELKSQLEKIV
jgi:PAS domain S-box-containing protein